MPSLRSAPKMGNRSLRAGLALTAILILATWAAKSNPFPPAQPGKSSSQAETLLSEAQVLFQQGSFEEAKGKILAALKNDPSSVEAYNLLGIVYGQEKDYRRAVEALQEALKLDPKSTRTLNNLGNTYVAAGRLDQAEQEFRAALRLEPSNRDANYNLGLVLMARGHPADAVACFQRVHPADAQTLFNLIRAFLRSGQTQAGLKLASEVSARSKDDVRLHFTLGLLLASEKQYAAAARELESADALAPRTFEILFNLGQVYLRTGDYAKSELVLQRALKLQPDSVDALYLLAQAEDGQKKIVDALELLVRAHKLAPRNTDVIFLVARLSMDQNYYEDAIPLLEQGITVAPNRPDLHAALGESYFMSGKVEKAIDEFNKLIQLDPSARSYALMALCYRHLGRFDEARKYLDAGLKQDPHNATCLFNLGYIESRQGNNAVAEKLFEQTLQANPDYSEALLELASLRMAEKKYAEALPLLKRYVKVDRHPAPGYYKLATAERNLHQMDAAERDMRVFQTLSKDTSGGPMPFQHLFDYLNNRASLPTQAQEQLDLAQLIDQTKKYPDQPRNFYLLADAYLKLGKPQEAEQAIAQLDQMSGGDFRTQTGVGVLLARYRLYDAAIQHFQKALEANPESDDVKFDLANAYFRKGEYAQALEVLERISPQGQQDDTVLSLLADVQSHLGHTGEAAKILEGAIAKNPDNDQYALSLALDELREGDLASADKTLTKGLARIPDSGKILWGLGIVAALEGNTVEAEARLQRAVELLPEWSASYSVLGVFYYQTGQIAKAREVLSRFKQANPQGGLDVQRIEETLARAPANSSAVPVPLSPAGKQQFLQIALTLADRTL